MMLSSRLTRNPALPLSALGAAGPRALP
jgi:hypothetical protein